jgi:Ca-activated chloride channel family protein
VDGDTLLRLPLVVAPRYVAGAPLPRGPQGVGVSADTDVVPDASRITPPLLPFGQHGGTLDLRVEVDTQGLQPVRIACSQHAIAQHVQDRSLVVELARGTEL